jgi:hypothetical protein
MNDFGSDELNKIYNGLDLKTKKEIDEIAKPNNAKILDLIKEF